MVRKRQLRWFLLVVLLVLGGTIAFYLAAPQKYGVQVGGVSLAGTDADLQIDRLHVVQNDSGRKDWELWADRAKVYRKKDVTHLENLRLRLFPKNGKVADVSADRGIMENQSRNMEVFGNVIIRTAEGQRLLTDSLKFQSKEKRISTDAKVLLEGKAFRLSGVGLRGKTDLGQYTLRESVSAVIYENDLAVLPGAAPSAPAGAGNRKPRAAQEGKSP